MLNCLLLNCKNWKRPLGQHSKKLSLVEDLCYNTFNLPWLSSRHSKPWTRRDQSSFQTMSQHFWDSEQIPGNKRHWPNSGPGCRQTSAEIEIFFMELNWIRLKIFIYMLSILHLGQNFQTSTAVKKTSLEKIFWVVSPCWSLTPLTTTLIPFKSK